MDHIQDVYKKKPDMINKIWDHLTKVNLKVDGKPFQVVYNEEEDELEYHGRSGNETKVGPLIDDMYRLFSKPINDAIRHIENRIEVFKRYKFLTFEVIDEILLLTAIINKEGKFVDDPDEIDEIAKELDTDVMPCLWKGKLSDEQRDILMTAISTDIIPTKDDFVKWVKDLFGTYKKFPKTLISRSTEFIEGIVFFYDVDGKVVEYKLVDPSFRQMVKDNHANMKQDGIENAEKYTEIYTSFLNWAEENAKGLDKNRMRSIEFNFIEMMKDPKIYNKLMKDGAGLTTITTDAYFLQPDRISDELKKAIKKHGKVYQLLYEKFVRLFYKAKKRGFVLSKEFQARVNKTVDKFADYSLNEDEIEVNDIIRLDEVKFQNNDYSKHNWKYVIAVINDIIDNDGEVKIGDHGEEKIKLNYDKEKLNNLRNKLDQNLDNPDVSDTNEFNDCFNNEKSVWGKIFKGTYSGHVNGVSGQIYESLVGYFYNFGIDADPNKWLKTSGQSNLLIDWVESCKESAKLLSINWKNDDFKCLHIDGHNETIKLDEIDKYIVDLFSFKKDNKVGGILKKVYKRKDKYNPADIILITKDDDKKKTIYEQLNNIKLTNDDSTPLEKINSLLFDAIIDESLIPISLKKIKKDNGIIVGHNIDNKPKSYVPNTVHLELFKSSKESNDSKTMWVNAKSDSGDYKIQFRTQTNSNNPSIELKLSNLARGGKGISILKSRLMIENDDYLNNDFTELWKAIQEFITIDPEEIDYNRISEKSAYKCFMGLYVKYIKLYNHNKITKESFYDYITMVYSACYDCDGAYYIIQ